MIRARSFFPGVLAAFAFLWYPGLLAGAQGVADREIFDGRSLAAGFDIGVNSSGGRTDWLKPDRDSMKMAYPSNQAWGSVFITFGSPKSPPRPSIDMSEFATLLVEVRGDPGTTIEIGIKDSTQPDDGTEAKVIIPVFSDFRTYAVPLTKFNRVDLRRTYVVTEFVLSGPQAQAVWFRRIG
ncbi:MAG: hypothetical protein NTY38_12080, partial [Acidobacteria bacterium]|nr:hypothetical protein [Acidobacteriota bacterium]